MPPPLFRLAHCFRHHAGVVNDLVFNLDGSLLVSLGTSVQSDYDPSQSTEPLATSELCVWSMKSYRIIASFPIERLEELFGITTMNVFFSSVLFLRPYTLLVGTTTGLLVQLDINLGLLSTASTTARIQPVIRSSRSKSWTSREVRFLRQSPNPEMLACSLHHSAIVFHIPKGSSVVSHPALSRKESLELIQTLELPALDRPLDPDLDWVTGVHWMKSMPSALLVAYQDCCVVIWNVEEATQLVNLPIRAHIAEISVDPDENFIAVYNASNFAFESYCLKRGDKIREIFREKIEGAGLALPVAIIPAQSCIAMGSHYGKIFLNFFSKELPHQILRMNDSAPVLCVTYYTHQSKAKKTVLATGSVPGSSTEFADIVIWETQPSVTGRRQSTTTTFLLYLTAGLSIVYVTVNYWSIQAVMIGNGSLQQRVMTAFQTIRALFDSDSNTM
ncbi:hypothetical protein BJ165DRAFT_1410370 [Panaeolus papilionaceus]|nr:hypothetical protein BJ165DRAFT_1410370 [Panaeolus papilionaceus]